MPLYQDIDGGKILYVSNVVFQLSRCNSSTSGQIVNAIIAHFSESFGELFNVKVVSQAWIHIELNDLTLAAWLHFMTGEGMRLKGKIDQEVRTGENEHQLFTVQYTHARCCSLIRLANREGLIKLRTSVDEDEGFTLEESIPWLDCDQKLRLHRPEEIFLLQLLVKMVDDLVFPNSTSSVNWITTTLKLCGAVESFWSGCRIWGEVKIHSLELAQARLGLLMATQLVLKSVLQTKLGISAPMEL